MNLSVDKIENVQKCKRDQRYLLGWFAWVIFIELLVYVLPYTVITAPKIYAAPLFYCVFAIVGIITVFMITYNWRDVD